MRNPEDTKYVWDEKNFNIIKKNIVKNEIKTLEQNLNSKTKKELVHDFIELTNLYVDEVKEHCKTRYEVIQLNKVMDILLPKK